MRAALMATPHAENVRLALCDILDGTPIYRASQNHKAARSHLTELALRHGLVGPTTRLLSQHRRVAAIASEEIERRLIENPEELSTSELNFIGGTSTDKLAKFERWGAEPAHTNAYASGLAAALSAIADGGTITLELRVERGRGHEIDVSPHNQVDSD